MIAIRYITVTVILLVLVIHLAAKSFPDTIIVPGVRVGRITAQTTEAELLRDYGKENVVTDNIHVCDGFDEEGTILFPADSLLTLEIIWKDANPYRNPSCVLIRGEKSRYRTAEGITLGTNLKELEKINGTSFRLYGFEWDFQGIVLDWCEGTLAYLRQGGETKSDIIMSLALEPDEIDFTRVPEEVYYSVAGDKELSSACEGMQLLNPKVYYILVNF